MEKKVYTQPEAVVISLAVEQGFQASTPNYNPYNDGSSVEGLGRDTDVL